ncbi:MAG: hypothetical protein ACOC1O_05925 [bacterium]
MKEQVTKIKFNDENKTSFDIMDYSNDIIAEIDKYNLNGLYIIGQIQAFGLERLIKYKRKQDIFQIIDKDKAISLVFRFVDDTIELINIIKIDNIYIAEGMNFENIIN